MPYLQTLLLLLFLDSDRPQVGSGSSTGGVCSHVYSPSLKMMHHRQCPCSYVGDATVHVADVFSPAGGDRRVETRRSERKNSSQASTADLLRTQIRTAVPWGFQTGGLTPGQLQSPAVCGDGNKNKQTKQSMPLPAGDGCMKQQPGLFEPETHAVKEFQVTSVTCVTCVFDSDH